MHLKKIISGGQTGADIAGIDAAIACNFPYGGWLPRGRVNENGPLDEKYKMQELPGGGYNKRTERNVIDSDGTVIFQRGGLSGGSDLTRKFAVKHDKPWLHLDLSKMDVKQAAEKINSWLGSNRIEVLNVAGKGASKDPEIYDLTFAVICLVLRK